MNTYTLKINKEQAAKVRLLLEGMKAEFDKVQYSIWRAKTKDFQAIFYESGKFLIQGKDVAQIANKIDEMLGIASKVEPPKTAAQKPLNTITYSCYIGTDESGKGDFFGPLVIAGVQVDEKSSKLFNELGIKDSKKLNDVVMKKLAAQIRNNSVHSVVVITPQKYNELYCKFNNLNKLLAWGHARAIENILEKSPCERALSDKFGDESLIQNSLMQKGRKIKLDQMVRAESDIAVAAASVVARAEFVKRMDEMSAKYNLELPKGASSRVIEQGKKFIEKYGNDELKNVAKLHFKTTKELLN